MFTNGEDSAENEFRNVCISQENTLYHPDNI